MKAMIHWKRNLILLMTLVVLIAACASHAHATGKEDQPVIQIAVLLDTSNSMDGLINQAKSQLWKIVNEFAKAKKKGQRPRLEVALFEYGNDSLPAAEGYIRQVVSFTTDLDKVSEELFALRTNGGSEYCGQVIDQATRTLTWSEQKGALKMVFIAGNEPFTQGRVNYADAAKSAIEKGIVVNTIFCGAEQQGVSGKWREGALLADGSFAFIDSDRAVAHIKSPHDVEISRLGGELNKTYIAYGHHGKKKAARQKAQDMNAAGIAQGASVQRAVSKSSSIYMNAEWDLVDAKKSGAVAVEEMEEAELPGEMKGMSKKDRSAYVAKKMKQRENVQKKIANLNKKREAYVAAKRKELAESGTDSFDAAVISAIHARGKKLGFDFE